MTRSTIHAIEIDIVDQWSREITAADVLDVVQHHVTRFIIIRSHRTLEGVIGVDRGDNEHTVAEHVGHLGIDTKDGCDAAEDDRGEVGGSEGPRSITIRVTRCARCARGARGSCGACDARGACGSRGSRGARGAVDAIEIDCEGGEVRCPVLDGEDVDDGADYQGALCRVGLNDTFEAVEGVRGVHDHHGVAREIGELGAHREGHGTCGDGVQDHSGRGNGIEAIRVARGTCGARYACGACGSRRTCGSRGSCVSRGSRDTGYTGYARGACGSRGSRYACGSRGSRGS